MREKEVKEGEAVPLLNLFDFTDTVTVTDSIAAPTTTSPPYVWDTAKWNLSTWGT